MGESGESQGSTGNPHAYRIVIIFIMLYFVTKEFAEAGVVMLSVPFALIGGVLPAVYSRIQFLSCSLGWVYRLVRSGDRNRAW